MTTTIAHVGILRPISTLTNEPLELPALTEVQRVYELDQTGGLDMLSAILAEKTSANHIVPSKELALIEWEPITTEEIDKAVAKIQKAQQKTIRHPHIASDGRVRRTLTRLRGWLRSARLDVQAGLGEAVHAAKEGLGWLFSAIPGKKSKTGTQDPRKSSRSRRKYQGRHHVQRAWFGTTISTAQAVNTTRMNHITAQQTSRTSEGALSSYFELPTYWQSHLAQIIEQLRGDHAYLHTSPKHDWICR